MAKRFTDTNKLKKKWLRSLKAPYKLLWIYLLDSCDHAGIWEVDFEIANIYIGGGVTEEKAIDFLKDRIHVFDNGEKWLIVDFIEFQYSGLNEKNPAHNNVIRVLKKYNLINSNLELVIKESPLEPPFKGGKEEEEVKEKEIVIEEVKEKKDELILPFYSEGFIKIWGQWKLYKSKEHNFKYKSIQSEQATLTQLSNLSTNNESKAIKILLQSMENGWKGIFELKANSCISTSEMDDYKKRVAERIQL